MHAHNTHPPQESFKTLIRAFFSCPSALWPEPPSSFPSVVPSEVRDTQSQTGWVWMAWGKSLPFAPLPSIVNISTCLKGLVKIHLFHVKYLKQCQSSRNITCHYWGPYLIPTAAVINYYKLDCLKQHKFVISHFWRSEV